MKVTAKKHLGQHFLTDLNIARKIVDSVDFNSNGILEIGPGMGVLTQFLIDKNTDFKVCEIDSESVTYLKNEFPKLDGNIIEGDFLKLNINNIFEDKKITIIGNFPYNISSQIVFKILENRDTVHQMVGMFQKEVADRIVSEHSNKVYGILSVLVKAFYKTEYLFTVNETVFNPPPKVKSAVIKFTRINQTEIKNERLFFNLVKLGFNQRRKTLRNALKSLGIPAELENHKFLTLRAEQLSVADFIELQNIWK